MTFEEAIAHRDDLFAEFQRIGKALKAFPRGPMNLTTAHAKATPEYRSTKARADHLFRQLRAVNAAIAKARKQARAGI